MSDGRELWIPLALVLALAVIFDIHSRRVPNWLVLAGTIFGIGCSLWASEGFLVALSHSLLGALAGLAIMLPLYVLRVMGAGDAKLMAAIGAFLGPLQITGAALLTFVAGGLLSLFAAICSRSLPRVLQNLRLMAFAAIAGRAAGLSIRVVPTTGRLPYALAIAVGTALQLWLARQGEWMFA